jgi:hypothetical protein
VAKALSDAEAAIEREPEWDKGYFRKAAALEAQDKLEEVLVSKDASVLLMLLCRNGSIYLPGHHASAL